MKNVHGDTKTLSASHRQALEKLADRRTRTDSLIEPDLLKRTCALSNELGVQLGLLIGRDGHVTYAILGSATRIYLPDLGRFRLDSARLRRLRFIVVIPDGGPQSKEPRPIAADLLTDLEKLRLDAVVVVRVDRENHVHSVQFAHLQAHEASAIPSSRAADREQDGSGKSRRGLPPRDSTRPGVKVISGRNLAEVDVDFLQFIEEIESELAASRPRSFQTGKDIAILIGVYTESVAESNASMLELQELARTAGITIADCVIQRRRELDPKTVLGKGKVEDVVLHSLDLGADLLVFDRELSPGQLRTISNLTELRVIDRSMLILDIFAQRAKSSEGRLQVELAQLKYSLPRLTERDTGLSRLSGGIGGRGPGETKLEISRRRARDRISDLEGRIDKLANQRGLRRERRQSRGVPVVAIVGYTNAGKSTLLNALTKGDVFVEDKLFATLDPSSRRMRFPNEREVVFVDTVGFIRELPDELVNAFRATLEEVGEADLLLHVVDASDAELQQRISIVNATLAELGVTDKPTILVLNKTDLLSEVEMTALGNALEAVPISAVQRRGLGDLVARIQGELGRSSSPFVSQALNIERSSES